MIPLGVTFDDTVVTKLVIGLIAWFAQMGFHEGWGIATDQLAALAARI